MAAVTENSETNKTIFFSRTTWLKFRMAHSWDLGFKNFQNENNNSTERYFTPALHLYIKSAIKASVRHIYLVKTHLVVQIFLFHIFRYV